ncbi:DUF5667 domain-containing protein [Nocardioides dilutus]
MSSLHPARRGAERFNSLLDSERGAVGDPRDVALLELVDALQAVERVEARPAFVSDLRERLMLAAATELVVPDSPAALTERLTVRTRRTPRERRLAIALGGFAIVGATTSMAVAAQSAIPGDVLYPLKRAMENAEAGFSVSDEAKGTTILENASGRLDEVDQLAHQDDVDAVAVSETLGTFTEQATEASELLMADYTATGSEDSINELRDFASTSIEQLAVLEEVIPEGAEPALLEAAQVLFEIDTVAANLCPLCESTGITEIPVQLLASGDTRLDDAAVATGVEASEDAAEPGQGGKPDKGDKDPVTTATEAVESDSADPLELPTQGATEGGQGNGNGNNQPQNPLGTGNVSIPTQLPSVNVPEVEAVVSEVVEGVNDVVGNITNP